MMSYRLRYIFIFCTTFSVDAGKNLLKLQSPALHLNAGHFINLSLYCQSHQNHEHSPQALLPLPPRG